MAQRIPSLFIAESELGGRGVFTAEPLEAGSLIEVCPVIVLPEKDLPAIHGSGLHDYYFLWEEDQKKCAIALGYGSLYNHSYQPNARYDADYEGRTLDFYTLEDIEAGSEITVNYNGEPEVQTPVWFDQSEEAS
jgi:hypothetical protein